MNQIATFIELSFNAYTFPQLLDFISALEDYNSSEYATAKSLDLQDKLRDYYFNFEASKAIYLKPVQGGEGEYLSLRIWGNDITDLFKVMLEVSSHHLRSLHSEQDYHNFVENIHRKYPDRVWQPRQQYVSTEINKQQP